MCFVRFYYSFHLTIYRWNFQRINMKIFQEFFLVDNVSTIIQRCYTSLDLEYFTNLWTLFYFVKIVAI